MIPGWPAFMCFFNNKGNIEGTNSLEKKNWLMFVCICFFLCLHRD